MEDQKQVTPEQLKKAVRELMLDASDKVAGIIDMLVSNINPLQKRVAELEKKEVVEPKPEDPRD